MKIGFFTDGYLPQINGVATSTEELARSLRERGNKVIVVAPAYPNHKDKDRNVLRLKSLKLLKDPELRVSFMFPDKILRQVLKENFDIIHGFSGGTTPTLGLILSKIKKKPYVFTYNTRWNQYTHYVLNGKLITPKVAEKIMRIFCNRCDMIVAPAHFIKEELIGFGVRKPITVIPNGIDTKRFALGDKDFLRQKLKLNQSDKIVLHLGRLAKEKSIDFIIKSFAKIAQKNKNVYLVIAGDGPTRKELENLTKNLNLQKRVLFLGFVDFEKVSEIYAGADVFASSSQTETQGMVVLEAIAAGLPIVAVSDKAFEQFVESGKDGFLVEKDETIFASKLQNVLDDDNLRLKISKNARRKAEKFSLEEIAKRFDKMYKELI